MHPEDDRLEDVRALLRTLDHPVPAVTAEAIAARARTGSGGPAWRWAAAAVLMVGMAGAVFALQGPSIRKWAADVVAEFTGLVGAGGGGGPGQDVAASAPAPGRAGIAVPPGPALLIVFDHPPPTAVIRVSLGDGDEVAVHAAAGSVTFTTAVDRLLVRGSHEAAAADSPGRDTISVEVPRAALRVEIREGANRLWLKAGDRIASARAGGGDGPWLFPLGAAASAP